MDTKINATKLIAMHGMSDTSYYQALAPHQDNLKKLATLVKTKDGKIVKRQNYNVKQLKYIIEKILDIPIGYDYNGITLVKNKEI